MTFLKNMAMGLLTIALTLIGIVVGGWLVIVLLYQGVLLVIDTEWWKGIFSAYGHLMGIGVFVGAFLLLTGLYYFIVGGDK